MSENQHQQINIANITRLAPMAMAIFLAITVQTINLTLAEEIQFNLDSLDVSDRENIDLTQFSRAGFIMPGQYDLTVHVNKSELPEMTITFLPPENDEKDSVACLPSELVTQLGLKPNTLANLTYWHAGECADLTTMPGTLVRGDLASSSLFISVPQAYLEYHAPDWDPPSRWDDGVPGVLFDYNANINYTDAQRGNDTTNASGYGITGANFGAWRLRANWQANYNRSNSGTTQNISWSQYYAYRAIKAWRAKLLFGQNYLATDLFESVRFVGASLISDDTQLPPNLRGYAPEVSGVARTNAKVIIGQLGRVLYESQVAPGPFLIQDLSEAVSGTLDVKIEEQDGSTQQFQVDTASIPYLSRPGQVRYKVSSGQPADQQFQPNGTLMHTGEFSWGITNGWSLLGGGITAGKYNALSAGIGRDLLALGAISFNATQSRAELPLSGKLIGNSYSASYSKRFEEYDTQVTFAGYRFSQRSFMTMARYQELAKYDNGSGKQGDSKQTYSITLNKQFRSLGLSAFLNYSYQTFWNRSATSRTNMSLARYFDFAGIKNMSVNLSTYRTELRGKRDDNVYLSMSIPFSDSSSVSFNAQHGSRSASQSIGYYHRVDDRNTYQMNTSASSGEAPTFGGFYSRTGDIAQTNISASYKSGAYRSAGISAQGGITATMKGAAMHRTNLAGGTRLMVDTEGVSGVPLRGNGPITHTNWLGNAVIADVSSYHPSQASIDINTLPDNIEAERPVSQITLTDGAIGYRRFGVIKGEKMMAIIRMEDGSYPPFGASVISLGRETGIVNDNGNVWLSGVNPGVKMNVIWGSDTQCEISLPNPLPDNSLGDTNLLLPCTLYY